jgi:hypothetical protein
LPNDAFPKLQAALDKVVIPEDVEPVIDISEAAPAVAEVSAAPEAAIEEPDIVPDAFADEPVVPQVVTTKERVAPVKPVQQVDEDEDEDVDALLVDGEGKGEATKKKERQKRRTLVYDEEIGKVVSKRHRKGRRNRDDWDDYLD